MAFTTLAASSALAAGSAAATTGAAATGAVAGAAAAGTTSAAGMTLGTKLMLASGLAIGAGTGYMSYAQARAANRAQRAYAEASYRAQREAMEIQQQQLTQQSAVERQKTFDRSQAIRSYIRVRSGESGIGTGSGTAQAMLRQVDIDEARNVDILRRNTRGGIRRIRTGMRPVPLEPISPAFEGVLGGLSAAQAGLAIGQDIRNVLRG